MKKWLILLVILILILSITIITTPTTILTVMDEINNQINSNHPNYDKNYFKYYYYDNITNSEKNIWYDASIIQYQSDTNEGSSHDPYIAYNYIKNNKKVDCYGMTAYLYYRFNFEEHIPARDIVYHSNSSTSGTHHTIQLYINGEWINPYYGYKNLNNNFTVGQNAYKNNFTVYRNPPDQEGAIPKANNKDNTV